MVGLRIPVLWQQAYGELCTKHAAMTRGVTLAAFAHPLRGTTGFASATLPEERLRRSLATVLARPLRGTLAQVATTAKAMQYVE
jgi:hypothetical protein